MRSAGHAYDLDAEERREGSGRRVRRLTAARPVAVVGKKLKLRSSNCTAFAILAPRIGLIASDPGNGPSVTANKAAPLAMGILGRNILAPGGTRLVAIGWSRVLPGGELVIQRGNLVQPIDDLFVSHRRCVATSPSCFLPEERGIGRNRGVRQHFIHVDHP